MVKKMNKLLAEVDPQIVEITAKDLTTSAKLSHADSIGELRQPSCYGNSGKYLSE